jgi:hypothetical protein
MILILCADIGLPKDQEQDHDQEQEGLCDNFAIAVVTPARSSSGC